MTQQDLPQIPNAISPIALEETLYPASAWVRFFSQLLFWLVPQNAIILYKGESPPKGWNLAPGFTPPPGYLFISKGAAT